MTWRNAPRYRAQMTRPLYQFGAFELDTVARELRRDGALVVVSPKIFDCLVWLVQHRDRAVGRDELIAAVWGRTDVADAQLGQLMRKLRRIIGDDGDAQTIIRTVPRFGYRWIAETNVSEVAAPIPSRSDDADARDHAAVLPDATSASTRLVRQPRTLFAILIVLLVLGVTYWLNSARNTPAANDPLNPPRVAQERARADSVAVLPIEVAAGTDREWAWLRLGLMDLIASHLRRSGLVVAPSDNIVTLAQNDGTPTPDVRRVHDATGASHLVTGSARRHVGGWKVQLQWIENGTVLREVEAQDADAVAAARTAADHLLDWLQRAVPPDPSAVADTPPTRWLQRIDAALLEHDFPVARQLLDNAPDALRDSPQWVLRQASLDAASDNLSRAQTAYESLLERFPTREADPELRANALLGHAGPLAQSGDIAGAIRDLDEAIEILQERRLPNLLGEALAGRGMLRMVQGDLDPADSDFSQARIALELGGDTLRLTRLEGQQANLLALRNRHSEALANWLRAANRFERFGDAGNFIDALGNAAIEQLALMQPADALQTIDRALPWLPRLSGDGLSLAVFHYTQARVLMRNGRLREARALLDGMLEGAATTPILGFSAAVRIELAHLALTAGEIRRAATLASESVALLDAPDLASGLYVRMRADARLLQIRALRADGQTEQALKARQDFTRLAEAGNEPIMRITAALALAEELRQKGGHDAANASYDSALREANRDGSAFDIAEVVLSYGNTLIDAGALERASTVVGQLAPWAEQDFDCALLQARLYRALRQQAAYATALARAEALAGERRIAPSVREPLPATR